MCNAVFIFSEYGFFYLGIDFFLDPIWPKPEDQCSNPTQCFLHVLALGPRSSGGIGDMMRRQSYSDENRAKYYMRWFYDILAFIILNIIGMNILFGIILDTFKELRNKRKRIELDQKNVCFICDIPRHWFDRQGNGFENHIKYEHNIMGYIKYFYYIQKKQRTEFTGVESAIYDKIIKEDISWFPRNRSISLGKTTEQSSSEIDWANRIHEALKNLSSALPDAPK